MPTVYYLNSDPKSDLKFGIRSEPSIVPRSDLSASLSKIIWAFITITVTRRSYHFSHCQDKSIPKSQDFFFLKEESVIGNSKFFYNARLVIHLYVAQQLAGVVFVGQASSICHVHPNNINKSCGIEGSPFNSNNGVSERERRHYMWEGRERPRDWLILGHASQLSSYEHRPFLANLIGMSHTCG